ncbi:MAG TPA: flagellar biosynthetic protein FliO [Pirellulaceae bacterium]|nr:flagellar biosynthetic protein FliO [Pirellulaceae bacterium]
MAFFAHPWRCIIASGLLLAGALPARGQESQLSQPMGIERRTYADDVRAPTSTAQVAMPGDTAVAPRTSTPLPLAPPRERQGRELSAPRMPGDSSTVMTVVGSLAVVLGLFFGTAWFLRRNMPKGMMLLPSEVLEQLGRAPLAGKQQMHLVRVGSKLLLLVVTPLGAETLTEITDPDEVNRLCGLCRQNGAHGPSAEFRAVLQQFEREPAGPGFLGNTARSDAELASAGRGRSRGGFDA